MLKTALLTVCLVGISATPAVAENSKGPRIVISAPAKVTGFGTFRVNCQTSHHLAGTKVRLWIKDDGILKDTRKVAPNGNCTMRVLMEAANGGPNSITVRAKYKGKPVVSNTIVVDVLPVP